MSHTSATILLLLHLIGINMQDSDAMNLKGPTGLAGEDFWSPTLVQKSSSRFGFTLLSEGRDGIFIDAPNKVFLDKHETIPLIGYHVGETGKLRKHSFQTTTRLILSHLESGTIRVQKPDIAPPPGPPQPPASPGKVVKNVEVDLGRFLPPGEKLGRYMAIMLSGPESSNVRMITLYPSEKFEGTQEFRRSLMNLRTKGGPPTPMAVGSTLGLRQESLIPEGETPIWKLSTILDSGRVRIRLIFRLEIPSRLVFSHNESMLDEDGKRIHATLPVTWVGFDEEKGLILNRSIGLPVYNEPIGDTGLPIVSGSLSISLEKILGTQVPRKTLYIWALALDCHALAEIDSTPR